MTDATLPLFALPVGVDFSAQFLEGLTAKMQGQPVQNWAKVEVFVNTQRTARRLSALLMQGKAKILPQIRVIGDLANDPNLPIAPAADPVLRHLKIADLVRVYLEQQKDVAPRAMVFELAQSLVTLLDELDAEGVAFEALQAASPAHLSAHWQRNILFLSILKTYVDQLKDHASGAEARQRLALAYLAEKWRGNPPQHPIIVAGSTGSRGSTAEFMRMVVELPQGAVVLPGFDFDMPADMWPQLGQEHPQYGFQALSQKLGFEPAQVGHWHGVSPVVEARNTLVSLALRPAPVTAHWLLEAPALLPQLPDACSNLSLIEAQDPRAEAGAIALCLRRALAAGKKAALVTPDRILARRVTAALQRWGITPDDSAGRPAQLTPPGMFLRMIHDQFGQVLTPLALVELLKHPLCAGADRDTRSAHLTLTRRLEIKHLRRGATVVDLTALTKFDPTWISWLHGLMGDLNTIPKATLGEWATRHQQLAEALCAGPGQMDGTFVWEKEAGKVVLAILSGLQSLSGHGTTYSAADYRALFIHLLQRQEVRDDPRQSHPDVAIWGTLEARVNSADMVIMAGLNDGVWPRSSGHDTWLNRDIRQQIGLPLFERRIGLSAHDFQQSLGAAQVVLSRAIRDGDAPTVASRWIMRLQNLLTGMGEAGKSELTAMRSRGDTLLAQAQMLETPTSAIPAAPRPCPMPPLAARPPKLSVTQIETLIRDPYSIYARHILKLKKLNPLIPAPDPMVQGTALHRILERFVDETPNGLDDADQIFTRVVDEVLADIPWPAARRAWRVRFLNSRDWFIQTEAERRQIARPSQREVNGAHDLMPGFTLTAKADRIDVSADGTVAIYDYKSGSKPTKAQIESFAVQLPLEGAIALAAGFEGVPAAKTTHLQLIFLGKPPAVVTLEDSFPVMQKTWDQLETLISRYMSSTTGYLARARPELTRYDSDYDQLSRRGEWQDGDDAAPQVIL